jgi:hypothetical protein
MDGDRAGESQWLYRGQGVDPACVERGGHLGEWHLDELDLGGVHALARQDRPQAELVHAFSPLTATVLPSRSFAVLIGESP